MDQTKILQQKIKEFEIQEFVAQNLKGVGLSSTKLVLTPLGEKIVVSASRPGLVVGRKGQSIKKLTSLLKKRFNLENPQIEISEVENVNLDSQIVAERIANSLERFGLSRFKGVGHKTMEDVMHSGALGIEIIISGKVPSARAKRWRFYQGYLKKCGQVAIEGVRTAYTTAQLKTGTIGIVVKIMPPNLILPDDITIADSIAPEAPASPEVPPSAPEETKKPKRKAAPRRKKKDESEGTSKE
jgi:small subunit ribosomal protein S3